LWSLGRHGKAGVNFGKKLGLAVLNKYDADELKAKIYFVISPLLSINGKTPLFGCKSQIYRGI